MRIKAVYTVENSYIIPLFTLIIMSLIIAGFIMHDAVVINSGLWQGAMKIEGLMDEEVDDTTLENTQNLCEEYIKQKSILSKNAYVKIEKNNYKIVAMANVETGLFWKWTREVEVMENNPAKFIRVINAVKEVK